MKAIYLLVLTLTLLSHSAFANRRVFKQIASEAQVGNGDTSLDKFNTKLEKKQLIAQALKELRQQYRKNCGPWVTVQTRRSALKKIDVLEEGASSSTVVEKLEKLYQNDEIFAIVGAESNNEIECSLSYFNIYGTDGSVLELRYDLGD